jgi:hypothetical protein
MITRRRIRREPDAPGGDAEAEGHAAWLTPMNQ